MCPVDSVSQSTCFCALTVTHFNPAAQWRDVLSPWLLSCDSSNCRVSSCFQLLPVRQTRLFLTNMPLEWEETHPLSREIKEVMLSVFAVVCNSLTAKSENATCVFAQSCMCRRGGAKLLKLFRKFLVKLLHFINDFKNTVMFLYSWKSPLEHLTFNIILVKRHYLFCF